MVTPSKYYNNDCSHTLIVRLTSSTKDSKVRTVIKVASKRGGWDGGAESVMGDLLELHRGEGNSTLK